MSVPDPTSPAAAAPRRPTAKPERYVIPAAELPAGLLERLEHPPTTAAALRPAATVVLLRERAADGQPEALLLRRPRSSAFAADAWVFPGGMVDAADRAATLADRLDGPTPAAWARRLGVDDPAEAVGYVVGALREAWEETGILLAAGAGAERCALARTALLAGERGFADLLAELQLRLDATGLLYLAHWITPAPEPRRYDTRFFAARVAPGAECELHGDELVEARWLAPADALDRFAAGELKLLPPTADTLRRLQPFPTLAAAWAALHDAPVPTVLPTMRRCPEGLAIEVGRVES